MKKPVLDHIGIAVRSLDQAKIYEDLGLTVEHVEIVETQRVKTAFLSVGDSNLELLEPTSPDSPIAKFLSTDEIANVVKSMRAVQGDIVFLVADKAKITAAMLPASFCWKAMSVHSVAKPCGRPAASFSMVFSD